MDPNNAFKAQPNLTPNHNLNYGPLQQPPYNPGWSMNMPSAGSGYNAVAMPPLPPNQAIGSYPQHPSASPVNVFVPPQSNYNPPMMPPQNNYNQPMMPAQNNYNPPMLPPQNNFNPMPPQNNFSPIGSHPAPPAMSYLQPSHPQQPRNPSVPAMPSSIPTYNPHPQMSPQMGQAFPQQPGLAPPFGTVVGKDEKKRMKKMLKEQEKMEKKHAKANKYLH